MGITELIDKYGEAGVFFGFVVTWIYFYFTNKSIKEIKEGQRELIGYMKEHEGRISHVEGRLNERQQQPAT